jgi:hypothetical protein
VPLKSTLSQIQPFGVLEERSTSRRFGPRKAQPESKITADPIRAVGTVSLCLMPDTIGPKPQSHLYLSPACSGSAGLGHNGQAARLN